MTARKPSQGSNRKKLTLAKQTLKDLASSARQAKA